MPAYKIEVFSQGKWLDRGVIQGKHALDAIRNASLSDKRKLPRRATMVSFSDYKPTEGLTSLLPIEPSFESKSYRAGNLVNPVHVFAPTMPRIFQAEMPTPHGIATSLPRLGKPTSPIPHHHKSKLASLAS